MCGVVLLIASLVNIPVITTDPMNVTVPLRYGNESAMFTCEADGGSDDIQYRWFNKTKNGDVMLEETSNTLIFGPVTVAMNNTQYYCVASNNGGNVASETGHLTIEFAIGM